MRVIALEEHVVTPLYVSKLVRGPRNATALAELRERLAAGVPEGIPLPV